MRRTIAFLPEYLLPWPAPRYLAKGLLVRTGRTLTPRALFSNSRRSPGPTPRTRRISLGTVICPLLVIRACFFKVKLPFLTLAQLSLLLQETSPCVYRSKREMINDTRHSVSRNHPFCEGTIGMRLRNQGHRFSPSRQRVQLHFWHRKVLAVISEQCTPALDRDSIHNRIRDTQRVTFPRPSVLQAAGQPRARPVKLVQLQAAE